MKKFLLAASSVVLLAGCSDDLVTGTSGQEGLNPDDNTPGVYIGVNFQMPGMGSTRSTTTDPADDQSTSNAGVEVGKNYENNVNEVLLILARKDDYGFIGAARVQSDYIYKHTNTNSSFGNVASYHAAAKFEKSQLDEYYQDEKNFDTEIAVFVVVNPNGGLQSYFESLDKPYGNTTWINQEWTVSSSSGENSIWSTANGGNFLMTNSRIAIREIPADFEAWELFSSRNNPFNLSENNNPEGTKYDIDNSSTTNPSRGAVNVQRACARFDFKDGSKNKDNTYTALYLQNADGTNNEDQPFIDVQLQRMSLVNMNSKFYYFERVSNNGLPTGEDFTICGAEKRWYEGISDENGALFDPTGGNYVVDFYAKDKYDFMMANMDGFKSSAFFEYPLFDDDGFINNVNLGSQSRWASSEISDILKNDTDNYNIATEGGEGEYHIWRYVTENIIPFVDKPYEYYQPNGLTTGIVFRAKMIANEDLRVENPVTNEDIERNDIIAAINSTALKIDGFGGQDDITPENFSWKNPILYMYAKKLYATWNDMCTAAIEASLVFKTENGQLTPDWNRNNSFYMAVFGKGVTGCTIMYDTENGTFNVYLPGEELPDAEKYVKFVDTQETTDDDLYTSEGIDKESANYAWNQWNDAGRPDNTNSITTDFKKAVTDAEITIYQRSYEDGEYGYYCYYYYWNRHNDNNRDGVMGPMEFCTVRNNVYKLSVSKISRLGHPRLDENDPETPKPNDPDESSDVYITVDSKVIPWVVRINEIEF